MPHGFDLILTLTAGLSAALICGLITQQLGISPLVGYLLAGVLIGPFTPGLVANAGIAEQLAEIGVVLLMFGVGLQFHVEELLAVRRVAVPGALVQSAVATALGALAARAFGWEWPAAIVFGVALSVASTVVLVRMLSDHRSLHTPAGHIAVGWLVVEDLFTVILLVLLPPIFGGAPENGIGTAVLIAALKVAALVAFTFMVGTRVFPWLLERVAGTGSRELFTLTVLVLALGIAVGSAALFGVSMALGAFLAGLIVGRSDYSLRAASEALPMRDAFAVLFFVSVGMLLDPQYFLQQPLMVLATAAVVLVGKPIAAFLVVGALRYPFKSALTVSVALSQIGEFSFMVAKLAGDLGVMPPAGMNTLVAVSILSILLNPLAFRAIGPVERWASQQSGLWRLLNRASADQPETPRRVEGSPAHRAIVVGYGPTGRTLTRLLAENGIDTTVIEMNMDTVRQLRESGVNVVYGDAAHRDTLLAAGIQRAGTLVMSTDVENGAEVVRLARELNGSVTVLARTMHLREREKLRQAGAQAVFSGEGEVALALTETVLRRLGATPEQIDRERERVHAELLG
jgi:CPA2 family monovalent cation:H+ antiporter-2